MGYRIITNGEFQHHGILGQKWGVITKNVGVNYIPIGSRDSSAKGTAGRVLKGAASGAASAGRAISGTGRAIIKGAKAMKADHDAKKLEKQHSAYRSGKPLSKKDIAKMTDQEVQNAINRRQKEQALYDMEHPQIAAGKEFFSKYVADALMSIGGDYAKKFIRMKIDDTVRDFIKQNNNYTSEQKRDLLNKLNIEQLGDRLARESYENSIRTKNERNQKLKNMPDDIAYEKSKEEAIRKAIDSQYDDENDRRDARIRNGVATLDDRLARENYEATTRNNNKLSNIPESVRYESDRIQATRNAIRDLERQGLITTDDVHNLDNILKVSNSYDKVQDRVRSISENINAAMELRSIGDQFPRDSYQRNQYYYAAAQLLKNKNGNGNNNNNDGNGN